MQSTVRDMDYHDSQIAELYDLANPPAQDTGFYLSLAGQRPCDVLDMGCGTGTLCCALAERGHRVTGVDPAAAMLAVARRKAHAEKVNWVQSSAQSFRTKQRFDVVVMTGHVFQIFLTDADALAVLQTMRDHLNERGRIAFETRNPQIDWATEWGGRHRVADAALGDQITETLEITRADKEFISFRTSYRTPRHVLITNSTLRFPSQGHLESLIVRAGLTVRQLFGDWDAGAFDPTRSREMIFVADICK
jgi:2-polyprenyl-3-methyl-5-hydroxy-6-metoxy-1,4-benzoquinol methylase